MQKFITRTLKGLIITFIFTTVFLTTDSLAQVELFGFGGYMTYSSLTVNEGKVSFNDGASYGFGLDVGLKKGIIVELNYTHNQTSARLRRFNDMDEQLFDMNTHYIQIGAQREFRRGKDQKVVPYALITLGATLFDAKVASLNDVWRFSAAIGGGGKIYLAKNIGIRLQTRLLMPFNFSSAGLWCGPGGCSVGVGSWASLLQFNFAVGIFVRLGK